MIIAPSILACDFLNLKEEITKFDDESNLWFHLDIMDGHYVPNLTFGKTILKGLKDITKHKLDAHLMVSNPEDYVEDYKDLGLHNFTFHWEAVTHHHRIIQHIKSVYPSVGISLNPGTSVSMLSDDILKQIDVILVMSVNPGFGGQKFIESTYEKIEYLDEKRKELQLNYRIQVDGGVTDTNAKKLKASGADILVAGSYIFKSSSYSNSIKSMRA